MMQTVNIKKFRKTYRAWLSKCNSFLERIKYFPWFSVLLALMLGWGGYQVIRQSDSSSIRLKQSIKRFENVVRSAFSKKADQKEQAIEKPIDTTEVKEKEILLEEAKITEFKALDNPILSELTPEKTPIVDVKELTIEEKESEEKEIVVLKKRLEVMEAKLGQLQSANIALRKELDSIHPQLENIRQALHAEAQQLSEIHLKEISSAASSENTPESEEGVKNNYSVYAVIQGRAWLNTPEGKILTVRIGSVLPPFGVVQNIDTESGMVYFDQGYVVGPSENDS